MQCYIHLMNKVRITYGNTIIDISEDDHRIDIHTGVYTVRVTTQNAPWTMVMQEQINILVGCFLVNAK